MGATVGFRLLFGHFTDIEHRIDVAGVTTAGRDAPCYDGAAAVVPAGDWRPINEDEAEQLRPDETTPRSLVVELVSRPLPLEPAAGLAARRQVATALDPLNGRWPRQLLACTDSPPGRLTTTQDHHNGGARIGLHVDNWDRQPYPDRLTSRRRLALNMGPGTRYLLLGDRTIVDICRALGRDQDTHVPHTNDLRDYVAEGHPLRCLRIRLDPGHGYIAPTEVVPHDGSTTEATDWSVAAFWLG
ncbi:hypothetical protein JOL79_11090 [Microbispora sp. RL4-1S]|uniref:Uncharacterized protein n=1 Tax=Microbispora oryzae TaxID=2806554 RepID=A0A940WI18_9ACTN|nr:hypothetical protein [Microbispora oryzae]MBP2704357.1 hypothetical protein [Microbispora oryzae]